MTSNLNNIYLVKVSTQVERGIKINQDSVRVVCTRPQSASIIFKNVSRYLETIKLKCLYDFKGFQLLEVKKKLCKSLWGPLGVKAEILIHKGSFINHVDRNLDFFDPTPPLWTILLNRAYLAIYTYIWLPPSPCHVHIVCECPLI